MTIPIMRNRFGYQAGLGSCRKNPVKPILMTAITTILGLSTLSWVGMGAEMLQPLAVVSIGGLTYATILTLFVVPVMYDVLHRGSREKATIKGAE